MGAAQVRPYNFLVVSEEGFLRASLQKSYERSNPTEPLVPGASQLGLGGRAAAPGPGAGGGFLAQAARIFSRLAAMA